MIYISAGSATKVIASLGMLAGLLQAADPTQLDAGWLDQVGKLGTNALLALAVIVLWRKLQDKDALLMATYRTVADSHAANVAVIEKMSNTLDAIKETVERMETVRQQLGHRD